MTVSRNTLDTIRHTFTRAQLAAALAEAKHPDIAEGIYADRPAEASLGHRALTLDYDDEGDLGVLIAVITRMLPAQDAIDFAAATTRVLPGHPTDPSHHGAQWPGWTLNEPTPAEWWSDCATCSLCRTSEDHPDSDCPEHAHAPWEQPLAGMTRR